MDHRYYNISSKILLKRTCMDLGYYYIYFIIKYSVIV